MKLKCPVCGSHLHVYPVGNIHISETNQSCNIDQTIGRDVYNIKPYKHGNNLYLCENCHTTPIPNTWSSRYYHCWTIFSPDGRIFRYNDHIQLGLGDV